MRSAATHLVIFLRASNRYQMSVRKGISIFSIAGVACRHKIIHGVDSCELCLERALHAGGVFLCSLQINIGGLSDSQ